MTFVSCGVKDFPSGFRTRELDGIFGVCQRCSSSVVVISRFSLWLCKYVCILPKTSVWTTDCGVRWVSAALGVKLQKMYTTPCTVRIVRSGEGRVMMMELRWGEEG